MKERIEMVQTSVNNAGDSIVSLSGSKPTVRPDEVVFSSTYLLTTGGLKHSAEHENVDICDEEESHYDDDHHDTGDADADDGDADQNYIDNDDTNDATADDADDVRLMMLRANGLGTDNADVADADDADADDATTADATLGRHLIGQSACSAGRAERRSGRLTESLEAAKSL